MAFLNLQCIACFIPFITAAFVITQVVGQAMQMSGKLQTLGITWEESQDVIRTTGIQQNAKYFVGSEQARN